MATSKQPIENKCGGDLILIRLIFCVEFLNHCLSFSLYLFSFLPLHCVQFLDLWLLITLLVLSNLYFNVTRAR